MKFQRGQSVKRLRAQRVLDPYSGDMSGVDWSDPAVVVLEGVAIAPSSSVEEATTDGVRIVNQMSLYADYRVDARAEDRIDDGVTVWECDSDPLRWRNPFTGWEAGSETRLRKVGLA